MKSDYHSLVPSARIEYMDVDVRNMGSGRTRNSEEFIDKTIRGEEETSFYSMKSDDKGTGIAVGIESPIICMM
jgi:hypothetical protein